ncbi:hypothetical protein RJ639_046659 [Escallonia herrerae]|uniref:Phospholipase D alpha 1 n=1 Tax=Escallonia herrerae TaxID=1293975 RepID=A0AA88WAC3_9ASTE|nr:hypothetical protein RJ639_046659 [Escallonia herrerae]
MDSYNSSSSYPYGGSYGYPHVPPSNQQYPHSSTAPYPPPSSAPYPPPNSAPYPPSQSPYPSSYPSPYNPPSHSHSGPLPYNPYPSAAAPPPPQRTSHSGPLEYGYPPPPHSGPLPYPYQGYPVPPVPYSTPPPPQPYHQHNGSFPYGSSHYQFPHTEPLPPTDSHSDVPSRVNSFTGYQRQDSSSSVGVGSTTGHDSVNYYTSPSYPSVYPHLDDQLANMNLCESHPSAPASPPAPAAPTVLNPPAKYQSLSGKYDDEGSLYGYPNSSFSSNYEPSYSGQLDSSTRPVLVHSPSSVGSPNSQDYQMVPLVNGKGSLKVLLLHGNLDIWVHEAKNLPNMDMFHKTLGDMFYRLPGNSSKITSDPYVSISVNNAVVGRTYVISNSENPVWKQHFSVPVAHYAAEVHFLVKDSDVLGSQLIGVVAVSVADLYSRDKVEGLFPILLTNGKPCKLGAVLGISIRYTPIEMLDIYHHGVGAGPQYYGVPATYFPLRRGGTVNLYQDAHVPDGCLPNIMLDHGKQYVHGKCWNDIFNAIRQARRLVYITGWSVWHKVRLVRDNDSAPDSSLGDLLRSKSQEGVRVLLLVWDDPSSRSIMGYKTDGVMQTHDEETRRFFKHSSVQEVGTIYTHHQKSVLVDADAGNNQRRIIAFLGGLDLCDGRYDTPEHPILRTLKTVHEDDYHNPTYAGNVVGCPREPWHDLHCKIDGPGAYDVLTNFEERWLKASKPHGIKKLKMSYDDALLRIERMPEIMGAGDAPCVSDNSPESWHVQIFRSIDSNSVRGFPKDPKDATAKNLVCGKNVLIDMSIHTAYVTAIRAAQHYIYIENQYFIGSSYNWGSHKDLGANNLIPMEIALKIAAKIKSHERFAAYIVVPMWPEGNPTGAATQRILFWQHKTMQMMYETIYKALVEVGLEAAFLPQDYLNFYCLGNREAISTDDISERASVANTPQALSRKNRRFMIYVHSKGMIVDDEYVILGSANINQRSMEGTRDTEIAMGAYQPHHTWARNLSNPHGEVYGYRMSLWAEHLGVIEDCFTSPESLECVRRVKTMGEMNWKQFAADEVTEMRGHLLKYPVEVDRTGKVRSLPGCETFPDVGGQIIGSFLAIQENLTI